MATFRVVLDACVLLPQTLSDVLLSLADAEMFRPLWTPDLLDEVERNLSGPRFGKSADQAAHRVQAMRIAFPLAEEETSGYIDLIGAMTNDPKDRHVLAAAVRSGAALIVTSNLKDFPAAAADPFDIGIVSPDEFLCDQLDLDPDTVFEALDAMFARNRMPPRDITGLSDSLRVLTPGFSSALLAANRGYDLRVEAEVRDDPDRITGPGFYRILRGAMRPTNSPGDKSGVPRDAFDRYADEYLGHVVAQALFSLPPDQRAAIVAVDMEGYSDADAASALGVSVSTIKSRCARARRTLAVTLELDFREGPAE